MPQRESADSNAISKDELSANQIPTMDKDGNFNPVTFTDNTHLEKQAGQSIGAADSTDLTKKSQLSANEIYIKDKNGNFTALTFASNTLLANVGNGLVALAATAMSFLGRTRTGVLSFLSKTDIYTNDIVLLGYATNTFRISPNGTNPTTEIDVTAGHAVDSTEVTNLVGTAMTKDFNSSWSAGDAGGFRASGESISDGMWIVYAISKEKSASESGSVDYIASKDEDGAFTFPTDYQYFRKIGAFNVLSSAISSFKQIANYFEYDNFFVDVNDNSLTASTFETGTLSAPRHSICNIVALASGAATDITDASLANSNHIVVVSADFTGAFPSNEGSWSFAEHRVNNEANDQSGVGGIGNVTINSSSQIKYGVKRVGSSSMIFKIATHGFWMLERTQKIGA